MLWVRVATDPIRQFYLDLDTLSYLDATKYSARLLLNIGELVSEATGENGNLTIVLQNDDYQCSRLFGLRPPLGKLVTVFDGDDIVFEGVIVSMAMTAIDCTLELEA